jgi:hypothetical protein
MSVGFIGGDRLPALSDIELELSGDSFWAWLKGGVEQGIYPRIFGLKTGTFADSWGKFVENGSLEWIGKTIAEFLTPSLCFPYNARSCDGVDTGCYPH